VTSAAVRRVLAGTYRDLLKNQTFQAAAALSYYSILSVFPALILLSSIVGHVPLPGFFDDVLVAIGRVAPPGTMPMINGVLSDILGKNSNAWLSLGTLGTLWIVSSAFEEMIESLDAAYEASDDRPFWKTRLLALGLAGMSVFSLICTIALIVVGPKAGDWLAAEFFLFPPFALLWPIIHWTLAIVITVFTVAMIYLLGPNLKQRLLTTLPGAIFSVACWIGLSKLLTIYFKYFANYNRTYGALGGLMALMTWLYWVYFILLVGGELNAEIAKERGSLAAPIASPSRRRRTDLAA
jgi:membrane protein